MSHCREVAYAIARGRMPVGVDIERDSERLTGVLPKIAREEEVALLGGFPHARVLWCMKEAVYKVIGSRGWGLWTGKRILIFRDKEDYMWRVPHFPLAGKVYVQRVADFLIAVATLYG